MYFRYPNMTLQLRWRPEPDASTEEQQGEFPHALDGIERYHVHCLQLYNGVWKVCLQTENDVCNYTNLSHAAWRRYGIQRTSYALINLLACLTIWELFYNFSVQEPEWVFHDRVFRWEG